MTLLFCFPDNEAQAALFAEEVGYERGDLELHHFPDGETLVRLQTDVEERDVILYCSLDAPDRKAMALLFFAQTARELGANSVDLISPYLGYMRQDKRFHTGEAVTSKIFAGFLSQHFDSLITIDPHLHRYKEMKEIYSIPSQVIHAADAIAEWIRNNVPKPVLIGPDEESDQWVSDVAKRAGAAHTVLTKVRHGDREVEVSVPQIAAYKDYTPVLVDDIISTARTMIETAKHLNNIGMPSPICIGVHAVFAGDGYSTLQAAGVGKIVTCNTIPHETNGIDITKLLAATTRN